MVTELESYKRIRTLDDAQCFLKEFPESIFVTEIRQRRYFLCSGFEKEIWTDRESFVQEFAYYDRDVYGRRVHILREQWDSEGLKCKITTNCDHDDKGNIAQYHYVATDSDGDVGHESSSRFEYIYDEFDLLVAETEVSVTNGVTEESTTTYTYDSKNRNTEQLRKGELTEYEYSKSGALILKRESGVLTKYVYSDDNRLIRMESDDGDVREFTYVLDSDGFVSSKKVTWGDGFSETQEYDKNGSLIRKVSDSHLYSNTTYKYQLKGVLFIDERG